MRVYHLKVTERHKPTTDLLDDKADEVGYTYKAIGEKELKNSLARLIGIKIACVKITDRNKNVIEDKDTDHPVIDKVNNYIMSVRKGKLTLKERGIALNGVQRFATDAKNAKKEVKAVKSKDVKNWKSAIKQLKDLDPKDREAFIEGEERETVLNTYEEIKG